MKKLNKNDVTGAATRIKFDESSWGPATLAYMESTKSLEPAAFATIIAEAKEIALSARNSSRLARAGTPMTHSDPLKDHRATLIEVWDSSDNDTA